MRSPQYLSPSALNTWQSNPEEYYTKYLADNRPPMIAQTQPMSIGSAFDAYVKSYLFERLFGETQLAGSEFELMTIFETQVEEHNREWALEAGKYAFDCYRQCGALADLLVELEQASCEPRFEFTVRGELSTGYYSCEKCDAQTSNITPSCEFCGEAMLAKVVPLLGKPDVWYVNKDGTPIILDFKVNGFCSTWGASPKRGYVKIRGPGANQDGAHPKAQLSTLGGVTINIAEFFECVDRSWAQQLACYAWLMGAEVGSYFIIALDQICCKPATAGGRWPVIRVAEHRSQIGPDFQRAVLASFAELWDIIHSDHIFHDLPIAESKARCNVLDMQYAAFEDGNRFIEGLLNG